MPRALALVLLISLAGCVATADYTVMRNDLNQVMVTQNELKKEVHALKKRLTEVSSTSRDRQILEALRQSQVSLREEIDALRGDLQALQAAVEEGQFRDERRWREAEEEDRNLRLELEALKEEIKSLQKAMAEINERIATATAPQEVPPSKETPEELYQRALQTLNQGDFQKARREFEEFMKRFPQSDLVDNAQFWIAESFYREGNYEEAILAYESLKKNYPKSNKIPDALYKQALAFEKLGDRNVAKTILKSIIQKFPDSDAAKRARETLERFEKTTPEKTRG